VRFPEAISLRLRTRDPPGPSVKAIIIGAGIGGLTAAIALQKVGIDAHVFERASELGEVGAGISLWSNATRVLEYLGLADALRQHSITGIPSQVRASSGRVLSSISAAEMREQGIAVGVLHREDLLSMLAAAVDSSRLHLNRPCAGFTDAAGQVTARFASGESLSADVLIGADGLNSQVRAQLFGSAPPRYSSYTAWRAVVDFALPELKACETWGRGRRFGIVPINQRRVYWYATQNAPKGQKDSPAALKQDLLRLFRGWHAPIEALLDATPESAILRNDIYDRDPLSRWSEGRVTLLGDAAHPMTPNLGQGACQAIEDAVVLASCLANSPDIPTGLRDYETQRIPRTSQVVLASRRIGDFAQWENPLACGLRDLALRLTPRQVALRQMTAVVRYDAAAASR